MCLPLFVCVSVCMCCGVLKCVANCNSLLRPWYTEQYQDHYRAIPRSLCTRMAQMYAHSVSCNKLIKLSDYIFKFNTMKNGFGCEM